MNRRKLLAGASAAGAALPLAALPAPAGPDNPDAWLMALADRYPAAVDAFNGYEGPDDSPEDNRLRAEVVGIFTACLQAQPTTVQGLAAKARVALRDAVARDGSEMPADQTADRMARTVMHDLVRLTGAAPAMVPKAIMAARSRPDAALAEAAAAYEAIEGGSFAQLAGEEDWNMSPEQRAAWEAEEAALLEEMDPHLLTLAATPSVSLAGMRAKARVLAGMVQHKGGEELVLGEVGQHHLVRSLLRDLLGETGA